MFKYLNAILLSLLFVNNVFGVDPDNAKLKDERKHEYVTKTETQRSLIYFNGQKENICNLAMDNLNNLNEQTKKIFPELIKARRNVLNGKYEEIILGQDDLFFIYEHTQSPEEKAGIRNLLIRGLISGKYDKKNVNQNDLLHFYEQAEVEDKDGIKDILMESLIDTIPYQDKIENLISLYNIINDIDHKTLIKIPTNSLDFFYSYITKKENKNSFTEEFIRHVFNARQDAFIKQSLIDVNNIYNGAEPEQDIDYAQQLVLERRWNEISLDNLRIFYNAISAVEGKAKEILENTLKTLKDSFIEKLFSQFNTKTALKEKADLLFEIYNLDQNQLNLIDLETLNNVFEYSSPESYNTEFYDYLKNLNTYKKLYKNLELAEKGEILSAGIIIKILKDLYDGKDYLVARNTCINSKLENSVKYSVIGYIWYKLFEIYYKNGYQLDTKNPAFIPFKTILLEVLPFVDPFAVHIAKKEGNGLDLFDLFINSEFGLESTLLIKKIEQGIENFKEKRSSATVKKAYKKYKDYKVSIKGLKKLLKEKKKESKKKIKETKKQAEAKELRFEMLKKALENAGLLVNGFWVDKDDRDSVSNHKVPEGSNKINDGTFIVKTINPKRRPSIRNDEEQILTKGITVRQRSSSKLPKVNSKNNLSKIPNRENRRGGDFSNIEFNESEKNITNNN